MCRPTCGLWSSAVLSRALADAERDGLVTGNVARLVEAPSARQTEAGALTLDDARRVIAADEDGRWAMACSPEPAAARSSA